MKKRIICIAAIVIILFISIAAYFRPLSLSDVVDESSQIELVFTELGVKDGEVSSYKNITAEQRSLVLTLMNDYSYRRTFATPFSDGSVSDTGDRTLNILTYDDASNGDSGTIVVTSSGKIIVNEKTYNMKNAVQFIEQILEIVR